MLGAGESAWLPNESFRSTTALYLLKNTPEQTVHDKSWISGPKEGKGYPRDDNDSVIELIKHCLFHRSKQEREVSVFHFHLTHHEKETGKRPTKRKRLRTKLFHLTRNAKKKKLVGCTNIGATWHRLSIKRTRVFYIFIGPESHQHERPFDWLENKT